MVSQFPARGIFSGQLEEHFLRRLEALPEATQRLMLIAAADPTGDVGLLWRAAQTLGIGRGAAGGVDAEQLVEIGVASAVPPSPRSLCDLLGCVCGGPPVGAPGLGRGHGSADRPRPSGLAPRLRGGGTRRGGGVRT